MHLRGRAKALSIAVALALMVFAVSLFVSAGSEGRHRLYLPIVMCEDDVPLIAYNSERNDYFFDIYTARGDGTDQRHLVSLGQELYFNAQPPAWSPDGSKIAYESFDDFNIHIINADGTGHFRLTHNPGMDNRPTWSPDGARIAFRSDNDLYIIDADGSGQVRLTEGGGVGSFDWSPDGRRIAFSATTDP